MHIDRRSDHRVRRPRNRPNCRTTCRSGTASGAHSDCSPRCRHRYRPFPRRLGFACGLSRAASGFATPSSASSSTGACTPFRHSETSGTRATCMSRAMPRSSTTLQPTARSRQFGYKDFIPMFRAEHFDANAWLDLFVAGRRALRRAGGRALRRLRHVRLEPHRLGRRENGPEARRRRRVGGSNAPPRPALRCLVASRRALVVVRRWNEI